MRYFPIIFHQKGSNPTSVMTLPRIFPRRRVLSVLTSASLLLLNSCSTEQASKESSEESSQTIPISEPGSHKKGFKTENPDHIISPFPPHNLIDISRNPKTGKPFQKGDFARDPSTGGIFRIP